MGAQAAKAVILGLSLRAARIRLPCTPKADEVAWEAVKIGMPLASAVMVMLEVPASSIRYVVFV